MKTRFRIRRTRGGRRQVFETDSPAEYLHCLIVEMAGDFAVSCDVAVAEQAGRDLAVEVRPTVEASPAAAGRFAEFCAELSHVFATFYECLEACRRDRALAWRVRHRAGHPWI
jgi:hypothetical protein